MSREAALESFTDDLVVFSLEEARPRVMLLPPFLRTAIAALVTSSSNIFPAQLGCSLPRRLHAFGWVGDRLRERLVQIHLYARRSPGAARIRRDDRDPQANVGHLVFADGRPEAPGSNCGRRPCRRARPARRPSC